MTQDSNACMIKLPNVSASIPQLVECIKELQSQGFNIPDYPSKPSNEQEHEIKNKYAKVLGSAVNPVLREGNSDRRSAWAVKSQMKNFKKNLNKPWAKDSKTQVLHMEGGDFYQNEQSHVCESDGVATISHVDSNGKVTELKNVKLLKGEVIDYTFMSVNKLKQFYKECIHKAKSDNVLLSLHLKATMMKISDPVIFGHAVTEY